MRTGIDTDYFVPATAPQRSIVRHELGLGDEAFAVLFAGRIGREKGVDVLVRACRELGARLPDLHLVVVGGPSLGADPSDSGRYADELRRIADDLPVTWLEARSDVRPLLQAADVAVVPSLWPEPLSRAVMEPLACGVPVVATRVGGTPELLTGWLSRYLVDPGDASALAECIGSLRRWRALDPGLGDRCRQVAVDHLSLDRETESVEAALEAAAAHPRVSKP